MLDMLDTAGLQRPIHKESLLVSPDFGSLRTLSFLYRLIKPALPYSFKQYHQDEQSAGYPNISLQASNRHPDFHLSVRPSVFSPP